MIILPLPDSFNFWVGAEQIHPGEYTPALDAPGEFTERMKKKNSVISVHSVVKRDERFTHFSMSEK
jgi:hypothetical protein